MINYYNEDINGNVIYKDDETNELYSFTPEEIEGKLLEDYPWDDNHIIDEFAQSSNGKTVHIK